MFWKTVSNSFRTVRLRLALLFAALFTALAATVFIFVYWELSASLTGRVDTILREDADEIISAYREHGIGYLQACCAQEAGEDGSQTVFIRVMAPNGGVCVASDLSAWAGLAKCTSALSKPTDRGTCSPLAVPGRTDRVRMIITSMPDGYALQIGRSLKDTDELIHEYAEVFVRAFVILLIPGIWLGWFITHKLMAGVRRVTEAAERIRSEGDFALRVTARGEGEEMQRLARAFDDMLGRIQSLITELRDVTDNIAHDLRSPITRMRGVAETTLSGAQTIEDYREMAGVIIEESDGLVSLINTMLEISETQAGTAAIHKEHLDLVALANTAHDLFEPAAEDKGVRFLLEVPATPVTVCGDAQRLRHALANLLDNAIKYTSAGGAVTLRVEQVNMLARLSVSDTGEGIAAHDLARIFDRYYRADCSRTTPGNGLGLSLARAIARAHGGDITVASTLGAGSCFTIELPAG